MKAAPRSMKARPPNWAAHPDKQKSNPYDDCEQDCELFEIHGSLPGYGGINRNTDIEKIG
jgi:hypothetical protein